MVLCDGKMILVGLLLLREYKKTNENMLYYVSLCIRSFCHYSSPVLTISRWNDEVEALWPPSQALVGRPTASEQSLYASDHATQPSESAIGDPQWIY